MATTYGYRGEFSSDEDIDQMEQEAERRQSKFDANAQVKPTKHQIEEAIKAIKDLPLDAEVTIADELLAALLDHYKTQRGPIVDSTRNLYKKIILRLIRNDQQANNAPVKDGINGNSNSNKNDNDLVSKEKGEVASSDDDEPMAPVSNPPLIDQQGLTRKNLDKRVVHDEKLEPMEVDSEAEKEQMTIREGKPIDMPTSSDSGSETEESESSNTEDSESESEVLINLPNKVKNRVVVQSTPIKEAPEATRVTRQRASAKKVSAADVVKPREIKKRPYTRSQADTITSTGVKTSTKTELSRRSKVGFVIIALVVGVVAFFLYNFYLNKFSKRNSLALMFQ